ncbi:MAG: glycosyltransferase, partial [Alphaproteobacteria bacterium]
NQKFGDFEHIVVDGGSSDNTIFAIAGASDERTLIKSEPDNGVCDAFNKGISRCQGDVIGFLHSDDFFADDEVLLRVNQAFESSQCDIAYGDLDYVSKDDPDKVIRHWRSGEFTPQSLGRGWMPPHPTVFISRQFLKRVGGFDCSYKIACDYDHLIRCLTEPGVRVHYIQRTLVKMRVGGLSNGSFPRIFSKSCEDYRVIKKNKIYFWAPILTLILKNMRKISQFWIKNTYFENK